MLRIFRVPILILFLLLLFVVPVAASPIVRFAKTWGGSASEQGRGVAVDSKGDIFVTGSTSSFGAGLSDIFLLKYDSSGNLLFQETWGGTANDYASGIAVDSANNAVHVVGYTYSFGAGQDDVLLLTFTLNGALQSAETWGGTSFDEGIGVAVDNSGGVYVTGLTESYTTLVLGGFGPGSADAILLKFDLAGNLVWATTWGGSNGGEAGESVDVTPTGDAIFVTGFTESFGAGGFDILLLKYNSMGGVVNSEALGGTGNEIGTGIVQSGGVGAFISGYTNSFGGGGDVDAVFGVLSPDFSTFGAARYGGPSQDIAYGIALNPSNASYPVYMVGTLNSTQGVGAGGKDVFLLRLNGIGAVGYMKTWGGANDDVGYGVVTDPSTGNALVTGSVGEDTPYIVANGGLVHSIVLTNAIANGITGTPPYTLAMASGTLNNSPGGSQVYSGSDDAFLLKYGEPPSVPLPPSSFVLVALVLFTGIFVLRRRRRSILTKPE